jgi:hypothetical protein
MIRAGMRRYLPLLAAGLMLLPCAHADRRAKKIKKPPPTCNVTVTVLKPDGTPLEYAAVVFQPVTNDKPWGNMELKTKENGQANLNLIPIGQATLVQVIANGYNTFGKVYQLPKATKHITIKLHFPAPQYSIYPKGTGRVKSSGSPPPQ